jgi:hypothetical protein
MLNGSAPAAMFAGWGRSLRPKSSAKDGFLHEVVSAFSKAYIETGFKVCQVLRKNKKWDSDNKNENK